MKLARIILFCIASLACATQAVAQQSGGDAKQLVGAWDLSVVAPGEPSRRMRVRAVNKKSDSHFALDAMFGLPGSEFRVSSAELTQDIQGASLVAIARSGAKVTAIQKEEGVFERTSTYDNNPPVPLWRGHGMHVRFDGLE